MNNVRKSNVVRTINSFHCPNCGAPINTKTNEETIICKYCGSVVEIEEIINNNNSKVIHDVAKEIASNNEVEDSANSLIAYGYQKIEDGEFEVAKEAFKDSLKKDVTLSKAYWGIFLANNYSSSSAEVAKHFRYWDSYVSVDKTKAEIVNEKVVINAYRYATEKEKEEYNNFIDEVAKSALDYKLNMLIEKAETAYHSLENASDHDRDKEESDFISKLDELESCVNITKNNENALNVITLLRKKHNEYLEKQQPEEEKQKIRIRKESKKVKIYLLIYIVIICFIFSCYLLGKPFQIGALLLSIIYIATSVFILRFSTYKQYLNRKGYTDKASSLVYFAAFILWIFIGLFGIYYYLFIVPGANAIGQLIIFCVLMVADGVIILVLSPEPK